MRAHVASQKQSQRQRRPQAQLHLSRQASVAFGIVKVNVVLHIAGCADTCIVHALWESFLEQLPPGSEPWRHISSNYARLRLRTVLRRLDVPNAERYGTHDFRRGHAEARFDSMPQGSKHIVRMCARICASAAAPWQIYCEPASGAPQRS